ncbi:hypothetical protein DPMN_169725 [Dreissena polymorpha]|uniref:Uncharacterized protein n=1 Tax=Dreissena polymorpha TaxID=45954 RepID=A0A9D4DYF3_DREPO|nr:hypothetical protein DPMN_169725 [Dreissena polymorpha]
MVEFLTMVEPVGDFYCMAIVLFIHDALTFLDHVGSLNGRKCGSQVVTLWSTIPEVPGSIPGRGTGNLRNASSVSHTTRDVLV